MTQDEQLDRLERSLQLFLKRPVRDRREARITAAKLGAYVTALQEYDIAKQALTAQPDDLDRKEAVRRAGEVLNRAGKHSDIEPKKNHIAFLHYVILAFQPRQALFLCRYTRPGG